VDAGPVRRGGDYQRHIAAYLRGDKLTELAGVAADHLGLTGGALPPHQRDPLGGKRHPAGLILDADTVSAQVDGLGQGGADAAHRLGDQVARSGVAGDAVAAMTGSILPGWASGRRTAAGAPAAGVCLRKRLLRRPSGNVLDKLPKHPRHATEPLLAS
jgi:hypothetical protein